MLMRMKDVLLDSFAFFVFSVILMTPLEFIGGRYAQEVTAIFFESLAPRTVMGLFVVSTMLASFIMFFWGKHNGSKKINNFLYEHIVFKVTKFGTSFSSASIGMLTGLAAASVLNSKYGIAIGALFSVLIFMFFWSLFMAIEGVIKNGFGDGISPKKTRLLLLLALIGAPSVYVLSYEPPNENYCEESTKKEV